MTNVDDPNFSTMNLRVTYEWELESPTDEDSESTDNDELLSWVSQDSEGYLEDDDYWEELM